MDSRNQKLQTKNQNSNTTRPPLQAPRQDFLSPYLYLINSIHRNRCLCNKDSEEIEKDNHQKFKCFHCQNYFHTACTKRNYNCPSCFLKNMIPTQRVKQEIFVGHLRKNKLKHQITFEIDPAVIAKGKNTIIQIRSVRISENTQTFHLFPDSGTIELNKTTLREFKPLHKQSSLKYRKDQLVNLDSQKVKKSNKIVISERPPGRDNLQYRIQPQDHYIGIYVVQNCEAKKLVSQNEQYSVTEFQQSKELLQSSLKIGSEDLSCEFVKIPLSCSLSAERMNVPARGIFCEHFQCFDLFNFISLMAMSKSSKWLCPLCKRPAYQFVTDCILVEILKQIQKKINFTHVLFKKQGAFDLIYKDLVENKQKLFIDGGIRNIAELPIQLKCKRRLFDEKSQNKSQSGDQKEVKLQRQVKNEKPAKKVCREIPLNAHIIDLTD